MRLSPHRLRGTFTGRSSKRPFFSPSSTAILWGTQPQGIGIAGTVGKLWDTGKGGEASTLERKAGEYARLRRALKELGQPSEDGWVSLTIKHTYEVVF